MIDALVVHCWCIVVIKVSQACVQCTEVVICLIVHLWCIACQGLFDRQQCIGGSDLLECRALVVHCSYQGISGLCAVHWCQ